MNVLETARAEQDLPDTYGIRVFAHADDQGQGTIALAFTEAPADDDQVADQDGTEVYVAAELAGPLAETMLDVEDSPAGPRLTLVPQAPDAP